MPTYSPSKKSKTFRPSGNNILATPNKTSILDEYLPLASAMSTEVVSPKGYNPRDITNILQSPYYLSKWQVYCGMEIFWHRVLKNISFIKSSISRKPIVLKPYEQPDNNKLSDINNAGYADSIAKYNLIDTAVNNMRGDILTNKNTFKSTIEDILDAYGKGISMLELDYEEVDGFILPWATHYCNAYAYFYDQTIQTITLNNRTPIDKDKFIVSVYRNRATTNITALGVYQSLAWLWNAQIYVQDYWLQSVQKYGMPYRVITYPQGSSKELKDAILVALKNFGASGYGLFPAGSEFKLIESALNKSDNAHEAFIDKCNTICDIVMLGNNLSTEVANVGSKAATETHQDKENSVIDNLTDFALDVLNHQFIPAILNVNGFDPSTNLPSFQIETDKDLDLFTKKLGVIQQLKGIGYSVDEESLISEALEHGLVITKNEPLDLGLATNNTISGSSSDNVETDEPTTNTSGSLDTTTSN